MGLDPPGPRDRGAGRGDPRGRARLHHAGGGRDAGQDRAERERRRPLHQHAHQQPPRRGPGVPYHILLRSVLDSEDGASAANRIKAASRSNSANYLIVDESGFCQDLETTPKAGAVQAFLPDDDGIITHANHFLADHLTPRDVYLERKRHTLARKELIDRGLRGAEKLTIDRLKTVLGDHTGEPDNVCQHPNASLPRAERTCTVAGVILAPESRTMHVAAGNPCVSEWHEIRLSTTTA
ncbi:C45 family autoproteolytic acyltransferase/hydrolase [Nonomuraea antimicrobica]